MSDFFSRSKLATHEVFQLTFTPKKYLTAPKPMRPNVRPVGSANCL